MAAKKELYFTALILIFIFFLLSFPSKINAQSVSPRKLNITNNFGGFMEIPYWVLSSSYRQLNITTNFGYNCSTQANPLTDTYVLQASSCFPAHKATILSYSPQNIPSTEPWKRNYYGIFTQHLINSSTPPKLIAFNHGENKNENHNGQLYQNTINPNISVQNCASGYVNGIFRDCWDSYHAFVTLSWQVYDSAHGYGMLNQIDEGPVVWPQTGYYRNSIRSSYGPRHPHGLISGNYIYLFYNEATVGTAGTKVARALVSSGGLPGSFKTYCNGNWVNSLPNNFNKNNISAFYSTAGGCASSILPLPSGQMDISFAVARTTQGGYLGIQMIGNGTSTSTLRLYSSNDLVNWAKIRDIYSTSTYSENLMHYPVFLDATGKSSELIDSSDFYIIGTNRGSVYALHQSLGSTNNFRPSDVNEDGLVNIIDIGVITDNYGRTPIANMRADVNSDGRVDIIDIGITIDNYGR